jgi:hypothetical protein
MVTVAKILDYQKAIMLRMRLEAEEIQVFMPEENTHHGIPPYVFGGFRIQVADEDADAAREIIAETKVE